MHVPTVTAQAAPIYIAAGRSVIPLDKRDKSPLLNEWKCYQTDRASAETVKTWFTNGALLAVVCGKVSGGYEGIDFDNKGHPDADTLFAQWAELVEQRCPGLVERLTLERSAGGGYHTIYLCDEVGRNAVLARRHPTPAELAVEPACKWKTLIETRGEGGYLAVAPSAGYRLIQGNHREPARITPDERRVLLECAEALNRYFDTAKPRTPRQRRNVNYLRPGDDFSRRGDVEPVLLRNGWKLFKRNGGKSQWQRPDKTDGNSGTLNESGVFFCYSSNAAPLEAGRGYSPFQLLSALEYNGDYRACARDLRADGYGDPLPERFTSDPQTAWLAGVRGPHAPHRPKKLTEDSLEEHLYMHTDGVNSDDQLIIMQTPEETAAALGVSVRTVQRNLAKLIERGTVTRHRVGRTTFLTISKRDKSTHSKNSRDINAHARARNTGQHRIPPPKACEPIVTPPEQEYPVCATCGLGELEPDEQGIWFCSNCTCSISVEALILEAWQTYKHVQPPPLRYEIMLQHVNSNGRPDVPADGFDTFAKGVIDREKRWQQELAFRAKLKTISLRALKARAKSTASKVLTLQQAGKRKQAFVWSSMLWMIEDELTWRKVGD